MTAPVSLSAFLTNCRSEDLTPAHLEQLLELLIAAEHPRSFRLLFWLLLRTLQTNAELHAAIVEQWFPSETDFAQILEDAGTEGTPTVLALEGVRGELERLWQLCDDAGVARLVRSSDPWEQAAFAPMSALYAEQQLDELIAAVANGRQWKDPAEILRSEEENDFDLEVLIGLAQSRIVKTKGGEALNLAMLRLLNHADRVN